MKYCKDAAKLIRELAVISPNDWSQTVNSFKLLLMNQQIINKTYLFIIIILMIYV